MRFVHFFPDDKFAKYIFKQFEALNIDNEYFVFSDSEKLKFVDFTTTRISITEINAALIEYVNSFDVIFIHFLGTEARMLLNFEDLNTKVFWIGWGGDYYWLINNLNGFELYRPLTYKRKHLFPFFHYFNMGIKKIRRIYHRPRTSVLNKIDFFSPVLRSEFDVIKQNYPFKFRYFEWNYGNLEDDYVSCDSVLSEDSKSILIGNSATYTNNFFDLFQELKVLNIQEDIYCPLTYGDEKLKKIIIKEGRNCFENFVPIVDHLDYADYLLVLKNCRNVIMGHKRQQAVGSLLASIYMGANVFLYKESFLYTYFHVIGIKVKSIEDLLENRFLLEFKILPEQLKSVRNILISHWGKDINVINGFNIPELLKPDR